MNDTVLIAVIAGAAALLPTVVTGAFALLNKRSDRITELEKAKHNLYNIKRMEALQNYYKCLSEMDPANYSKEKLQEFIDAHAQLSLFVTQETLGMMEILMKKFEMSAAMDHQYHPDFNAYGFALNLIRQMNAELNLAEEYKEFYGGKKTRHSTMERKKKAEQFGIPGSHT